LANCFCESRVTLGQIFLSARLDLGENGVVGQRMMVGKAGFEPAASRYRTEC